MAYKNLLKQLIDQTELFNLVENDKGKGIMIEEKKKKILLQPIEVAEQLGVSVDTLSVWRCTKRYPALKYIKVGRIVRYKQEAVDAFLAERTV